MTFLLLQFLREVTDIFPDRRVVLGSKVATADTIAGFSQISDCNL